MSQISRTRNIITATLTAAFIVLVLVLTVGAFRSISTGSSDDSYEDTIAQYESVYTSHFPKTIPSNAKSFTLFHEPGFMQGATRLQLRLALPSKEISKIRDDLNGKFISHAIGIRKPDDSPDMMPHRISRDKANIKGTSNCDILTLASTPEDEWNHPTFSGIAICDAFDEVLYWYEDW